MAINGMDATFTKGTFVHKPVKSKHGKSTNFKVSPKEFQDIWKEIKEKIKDIENSSYQATFDAILKFVQNCVKVPNDQKNEIPAAVIQMGVNMPDHSNIFKRLEQLLNSSNNYTVILEARKCSNFSSTLQLVTQELHKQFNSKAKSSPSKRPRLNSHPKLRPIVLLIQDVEIFNSEVLEELILNCKIYIRQLPIVLVFGMSSAMVTLHSILPQKVLCHLWIETFHSFTATDYLTRIIEKVIMDPELPFKLGPKVFRLVVDTVLYHDFSVTNLSLLLRFAFLEHFYNSIAASLCCSEFEIEKRVNSLKNDELQFFKELPSLKLYRENNPDIGSTLSNPSAIKSLLIKLLKNLFKFQRTQMSSLQVLHQLTKDLPGSPLGKQFREIYLLNLDKQICLTKGFKEAEQLLKFQSQSDLLCKVKTCLELLQSSDQEECQDLLQIIENSIQKLSDLTVDDFKNNLEKPYLENEKFKSRFELQEKMRSSIKLKRSKFETVRTEVIDGILSYFKSIHSPMTLPLHEVLFFDDVSALKRHLMPSPRLILCSALTNPQRYLQCKCCKIAEPEEILPSMPDLCVLYKLHMECGKLINLCDWLESFKSIKGFENEKKHRKVASKNQADNSKINVRFLHAASELQLLGFIKPTKRKTDHVARLTFGTF